MRLKKHLRENVGMTADQTGTYLSVMVYLPLFSIQILLFLCEFSFSVPNLWRCARDEILNNCSLDRQYVICTFKSKRKNVEAEAVF